MPCGMPRRYRGVSTSLAIGTLRPSALYRGICGPGLTPVPPARGGYEPWRRETAPGSAFRHGSGRRPAMSRDATKVLLPRIIVNSRGQIRAKLRESVGTGLKPARLNKRGGAATCTTHSEQLQPLVIVIKVDRAERPRPSEPFGSLK